jgi:CRISPR-associated Cas5-like protein
MAVQTWTIPGGRNLPTTCGAWLSGLERSPNPTTIQPAIKPSILFMKPYALQLEISGPTAMWTRPDTGSSPVSYVAPTFSAVKGNFESVLRWKSVNASKNV